MTAVESNNGRHKNAPKKDFVRYNPYKAMQERALEAERELKALREHNDLLKRTNGIDNDTNAATIERLRLMRKTDEEVIKQYQKDHKAHQALKQRADELTQKVNDLDKVIGNYKNWLIVTTPLAFPGVLAIGWLIGSTVGFWQ